MSRTRTTAWHRVHQWPRRYRWPLKAALFALVCVLVLFPRFWLIPEWLQRLSNLNALLDPTHPRLAPLETEVRAQLGPGADDDAVQSAAEAIVYAQVPYAFDWETWGVMDYVPTVDEVFAQGREDCDGRAIVAASLLRRLGHDAWVVSDLKHVWVVTQTPRQREPKEIMGPGTGAKTLVSDETGTRTVIDWGVLANVGRSLTFGIAAFPLSREMIVVGALVLLTLHPRLPLWRIVLGSAALFGALALFRSAGLAVTGLAASPWLVWVALVVAVGGWLILALRGLSRRSSDAAPVNSRH